MLVGHRQSPLAGDESSHQTKADLFEFNAAMYSSQSTLQSVLFVNETLQIRAMDGCNFATRTDLARLIS